MMVGGTIGIQISATRYIICVEYFIITTPRRLTSARWLSPGPELMIRFAIFTLIHVRWKASLSITTVLRAVSPKMSWYSAWQKPICYVQRLISGWAITKTRQMTSTKCATVPMHNPSWLLRYPKMLFWMSGQGNFFSKNRGGGHWHVWDGWWI